MEGKVSFVDIMTIIIVKKLKSEDTLSNTIAHLIFAVNNDVMK